ncbi:MAG: hypothetical protein ABIQ47_03580 [Tepidiformaceae bacterium]
MTKTSSPTVVCAWCDRLLTAGGVAISHGICRPCARSLVANLKTSPRFSVTRRAARRPA